MDLEWLNQISQWLVKKFSGNRLKKTLKTKAGFTPAFTMVELIFVIVVLGILAAVAIPKLAASRDDAVLVKGKSQISAIRSGIALTKSTRLLKGISPYYPPYLEGNATNNSASNLFYGASDDAGNSYNILEYAINSGTSDGHWSKVSTTNSANPIVYNFYLSSATVQFEYTPSSGTFDCDHTDENCQDLAE
jgi:general secretion pathway protein G